MTESWNSNASTRNSSSSFRDFIYKKCGIRIDEKKVTLLSNRIRRRLKAGDFENFDVYYRFLTSPAGAGELESFWTPSRPTKRSSFARQSTSTGSRQIC